MVFVAEGDTCIFLTIVTPDCVGEFPVDVRVLSSMYSKGFHIKINALPFCCQTSCDLNTAAGVAPSERYHRHTSPGTIFATIKAFTF